MTEKINIYAYLSNSHYQKNSYEKFLPKWLELKCNQLNNSQFEYHKFSRIHIIDDYRNSYKNNEALIEKVFNDKKPDIFINLPSKFVIEKGVEFFEQNNCITFTGSGQFSTEIQNLKNTSIFSLHNKLFSKYQSLSWIVSKLKPKQIIFFHKKEIDMKLVKKLLVKTKYEHPIKSIKLNIRDLDFMSDGFKLKDTLSCFLTEPDSYTEEDFTKNAKEFISKNKIHLNKKTLVVHDLISDDSFFLMNALKNKFGEFPIFDLTTSGWAPKNISSIFHTYSLDDRYAISKELNELFPNMSDFEYMDIKNLYKTIGDPLFLIKYLINENKLGNIEKNELLLRLKLLLKSMNKRNDTFVGMGANYKFKENHLINKESFFYRKGEIPEIKKNIMILYEFQPNSENFKEVSNVWQVFIDIIKVKEVDISKGLWFTEFIIEINSHVKNAIDYINFKNNSSIDNLWDIKKIKEVKKNNRFQSSYRIHGSLDFTPSNKNFPFDAQSLRIEYAIESSMKNSILQPIPRAYADKDFFIDGWQIKDSITGIKYYKSFEKIDTDLTTNQRIYSSNICEWIIKRRNSMASIKLFIPLYILLFLSWYSSFLGSSDSVKVVGINTTVFLAGIALYFSAEKPKTSGLTIIDKFFTYFYLAIAALILTEFSIFFNDTIYKYSHTFWQIFIPIIVVFSVIFLIRKSKS